MADAAGDRPKPPRDPFGPPLEHGHVREVFRRLSLRPQAEQEAFVAKVNWNLLDETTEFRLMGWLIDNLQSQDPARQAYVVKVLNKLPHFRRAKHAPRFQRVLGQLPPEVAAQVADAFGPVLGGAPKRPKGAPAATGRGATGPGGAPQAPKIEAAPPKEATGEDLSKLKDFFGKFGGAR